MTGRPRLRNLDTESGKIKRVSYEEISRWILDSWRAVTVTCKKKWISKSFWRYFNTRNRRSRRVNFRKWTQCCTRRDYKCTSFIWLWFRLRFCWFWVTSLYCLRTMNDILCFTLYSCICGMKYLQKHNFRKWNEIVKSWFQINVIYFRNIRCFKLLCT
jgi:hypothetical protein